MSRGTRIVLIVAAVCVSASFLMAGAGAVYVYRDGMIDVNVQEKQAGGSYIHVMVPTTLVRVALAFVPFDDRMSPGPEARRYWPLVEAACAGIARSPDGVLVQVDGPDTHITIEKRGGSLVIDVDDADAKVHVSIPVRAVEYVVRRMRPSPPGWGPRATISLSEARPAAPAPASMPARATPRA
jgi:hypothetical protein